jgi:hypothetical protein
MSSRVFKAKTGHSEEKPQICGLSNREVSKGDPIMYLVCHGSDARPEYQIKNTAGADEKTNYEMDDGRQFRSVFGGWHKNEETGKREKQFTWQEQKGTDADGYPIWATVTCWSHIVLAEVAEKLGYSVKKKKNGKWSTTTAHEGDRAVGSEHTVSEESENAMEVLARAACTDEELGLVAPGEESERERLIREENEAIADSMNAEMEAEADHMDRLDAEALGMTLEQYRRVLANQNG